MFRAISQPAGEDNTPITSYLGVGELASYVSFREEYEDYDALSTEQKQALLNYSSAYLDNMYRWVGSKADESQTLEFPRVINSESQLPDSILRAVALLALYFMNEDIGDFSQQTVGDASVSYNFTSSIASREINNLLLRYKSRTVKFNIV